MALSIPRLVRFTLMVFVALALMLTAVLFSDDAVYGQSASKESFHALRQLIERQQAQIEAQAKTIEELKNRVNALAKSVARGAETLKAPAAPRGIVKSRSDKASVKLYGQVNRGILYTDDGHNQDFFHVDNDNSSTRIGLLANAKASNDLTIGGKIEVQFESNSTASRMRKCQCN